ncbi:MAG: hypothetical protein IJ955_08780, partial [Oscillospiraceae bacterium]|nr:hypothetical protein [Oscillospiraceae bacterium]
VGGYMATAINDFIQGIVMLFGIVAVIIAVLNTNGGLFEGELNWKVVAIFSGQLYTRNRILSRINIFKLTRLFCREELHYIPSLPRTF